jgi:hypothetical protein
VHGDEVAISVFQHLDGFLRRFASDVLRRQIMFLNKTLKQLVMITHRRAPKNKIARRVVFYRYANFFFGKDFVGCVNGDLFLFALADKKDEND